MVPGTQSKALNVRWNAPEHQIRITFALVVNEFHNCYLEGTELQLRLSLSRLDPFSRVRLPKAALTMPHCYSEGNFIKGIVK